MRDTLCCSRLPNASRSKMDSESVPVGNTVGCGSAQLVASGVTPVSYLEVGAAPYSWPRLDVPVMP